MLRRIPATPTALLSKALAAAASDAPPAYVGSARFSSADVECAEHIGLARKILNDSRGRGATCAASDAQAVDQAGALAEILAGRLLSKSGCTVPPLVALEPDSTPDVTAPGGLTFDIKAAGIRGSSNVALNCDAMAKKPASGYVCVRLARGVADFYVVGAFHTLLARPVTCKRGGIPLPKSRFFYLLPLPSLPPITA